MAVRIRAEQRRRRHADPYATLGDKGEIQQLEATTKWTKADLQWLYKTHFLPHVVRNEHAEKFTPEMRIAPIEPLCAQPGLSVHPLMMKVLSTFNQDRTGNINFSEYAQALRALSIKNTLEQKLQFAFSLFDSDGDGTVQGTELFELCKMALGRAHDDHNLQRIVDHFLRRFPAGFTFDSFTKLFDVNDLNKLTLALPAGAKLSHLDPPGKDAQGGLLGL